MQQIKASKWLNVEIFPGDGVKHGPQVAILKDGGRVVLEPDELPALVEVLADGAIPAVEALVKAAAVAELAEIRRLEAIVKPPERMKSGR